MATKLSDRAQRFLVLIHERSEVDRTTGEVKLAWVPGDRYEHDGPVGTLGGSGDRSVLKALLARGLIKKHAAIEHYHTTEDGLLEYERLREAGAVFIGEGARGKISRSIGWDLRDDEGQMVEQFGCDPDQVKVDEAGRRANELGWNGVDLEVYHMGVWVRTVTPKIEE